MFIKLGIIVGIVIFGGMIFSTEIETLFPNTSATVIDSLKDDMSNFGSIASGSVEQRIDDSIDKIVDKTSDSISNEISEVGDSISNEISEVGDNIASEISESKKSSQKTINEEISNLDPIDSIKNIFSDIFNQ